MIENIVKKNHIQLNVKVDDWKDAIKKVASPLLDDGIIEEIYIDSMIDGVEEFGPYIAIDQNIALAHARPGIGTNDIGMSFMTVDNPVDMNSDFDPIKLFVCLSAVDSESHIDILMELSNILEDRDEFEKLILIDDVDEFYNKLLELS